jgi:probable rRNA maturation factor
MSGLRLEWNNEIENTQIPQQWIQLLEQCLQAAAAEEQLVEGEVSLSFVDDETIRELNLQYRGIDRPTDVLSFPIRDELFPDLLGDIVISLPTARRQSEEYGHSLEREIGFLFTHGFLHLLGYDHEDETNEKTMFAKQERILRRVGLTR